MPLGLVVGPVDTDVGMRALSVVLELDNPSVVRHDLPHAVLELSVGHVVATTMLQLLARATRNAEPRQRHARPPRSVSRSSAPNARISRDPPYPVRTCEALRASL